MEQYPYSTELKKPISAGDTDFFNPKVQKSMAAIMKIFQLQAKLARVPKGVKKSWHEYPGADCATRPYLLAEPAGEKEKLPAVIYFHGGGFMYPIQSMMVKLSGIYAGAAHVRVFLPEYRFAPQHSCKTILEDCYSMVTYVYNHAEELQIDQSNIILYGDSAGGALAANVTHMLKDRNGPKIKAQMLIYPVTDDQSEKYESVKQYPNAAWSAHANRQMWQLYFSKGDCGMRKYAVPMEYENLADMPPAYVEPQEIDILRDEAVAYAEKLKSAGVPVQINLIKASYHGFDADVKNPFVKRVITKRIQVLKEFTKWNVQRRKTENEKENCKLVKS